MLVSSWDMTASFVNNDAIDEKMFAELLGEIRVVFCNIDPFIAEMRETLKRPQMLANLESFVMRQPSSNKLIAEQCELIKMWMTKQAETGRSAG